MSRVYPDPLTEVARDGRARYVVEPTEGDVDVWERTVPFAGGPAGGARYRRVASGIGSETVREPTAPLGSLIQVRLQPADEGDDTGANPLGKLDLPALASEQRDDFLTRCTEGPPQLEVTTGGTFVGIVIATPIRTRVRVQLATQEPKELPDPRGFPYFPSESVVATAVSEGSGIIHRLAASDELLRPATTGHTAMVPAQDLYFDVLAWDEDGMWDHVWSRLGATGVSVPEIVRTLSRRVDVRIDRLVCLADSDKNSDGEATFTFTVRHPGPTPTTRTVTWDPMEDGSVTRPSTTDVTLLGAEAAGPVRVTVSAVEDDSGSFPEDDDDTASTDPFGLGRELDFPTGETTEVVRNAVVNLSAASDVDQDPFRFAADVVYSVAYS